MRWTVAAMLGTWLLATSTHAEVKNVDGRIVEIFWTAPGAARALLTRVDLDALPQRTTTARDPQYGVDVRMRGVSLADVLARAQIPKSADLALLRFNNGLQIPLSFRDQAFMAKLAPFVARATTRDPSEALRAGQVESPARAPTTEDLRPVSFNGNKMVVSDAGLASMLPTITGDLRPWMYADSLFAIELVQNAAWEAHFDAGPTLSEGKRVYLGSCRYCHAIRGSGGALGWDFVDPYPIYSPEWMHRLEQGSDELARRPPARTMLSIHVRYRAGIDGNRTMPALRGMKPAEITALWDWLQAVAVRPAR
jgi:mono/diheme cytochrome c family protein